MAFDTTRLIAQTTINGCLPTGRFQDSEVLDMLYDVLLSEIVPLVLDLREEYYVKDPQDTLLTAGRAAYPVPSRAIAGTLREVKLISGNSIIDLQRVELDDIDTIASGTPDRFYMQGNDVMLYPTPDSSANSLRLYYYTRPSKLVTAAECARITAVNTATNTVTASLPSSWTTSDTFDLVRGKAHYDILAIDLAASSVGAGAITFSSSLPITLTVGDYIAKAEESSFPWLPPEGHMSLVYATAAAALQSIGHPSATEMAQKAEMVKGNFKSVMGVRIQGAPKALSARVL